MTDLDDAYLAMDAAPEDDAARLRYFERLADTELFMVLREESAGDTAKPMLFDTEGHQFALVFDRPDRLSDFAEGEAAFVALSGRGVLDLLAGHPIGLAVNLGTPSANLLPADALEWLRSTLSTAPTEAQSQIKALHPPASFPEPVLLSLDRKLSMMAGRARQAWLVDAEYADSPRMPLLVFLDAAPGAEGALSQAVSEALVFSGVPAGALDVSFARSSDTFAARLAKHGLRFDLPEPETLREADLPAPGSDPAKPPILR